MRKWKRRLSTWGGSLMGVVVVVALILWVMVVGEPEWYRPTAMSDAQREAAAASAESKIIQVHNAAAQARADERANGTRGPATLSANAIVVSFTEDELNAFFSKWAVLKAGYQKFMSEPYIVLQDGRLIVAGRVKDMNAVASLHFDPSIDQKGQFNLKLARVLAGKLPLPEAVFNKYQQQAANGVARRMPIWRRNAAIDHTGVANNSAISAAMGELLIDVLNDRPAEPVLFVPLVDGGKSIPVRLLDVKIKEHAMTLAVQPMTAEQRTQLLEQIRKGPSAF